MGQNSFYRHGDTPTYQYRNKSGKKVIVSKESLAKKSVSMLIVWEHVRIKVIRRSSYPWGKCSNKSVSKLIVFMGKKWE